MVNGGWWMVDGGWWMVEHISPDVFADRLPVTDDRRGRSRSTSGIRMTRFDLHIHSALSACAEDVISPRLLLARARAADLTLLAVTDHNASANVAPSVRAGGDCGVCVIPGMEVTSREEVHVLVFFPDLDALRDFQDLVDRSLPDAPNLPEVFGRQLVYNDDDEIVDVDDRLRQVGTSIGLAELQDEVKTRNGTFIPAHVYRTRFSLWSQLGFVDTAAGYDAIELSRRDWVRGGHKLGDRVDGYAAITGSDAYFLEDIGRAVLEVPENVGGMEGLMQAIRRVGNAPAKQAE